MPCLVGPHRLFGLRVPEWVAQLSTLHFLHRRYETTAWVEGPASLGVPLRANAMLITSAVVATTSVMSQGAAIYVWGLAGGFRGFLTVS